MSEENLRKQLEIDTKLDLIKEHKCCAESILCIETYMYCLEQEFKQLKEQLKSKKQELKGFTNVIAEYLGFDNPEHTAYDEIFDKINQLKTKLQQSEEVIEECKQSIDNFMTHIDDGFCADMMTFIDILNKYKKEDKEGV